MSHYKILGFHNKGQAKKSVSRTQILANPASRGAVKSRIPSTYFAFFPNPAPYLGQIPDPENTLPDPVTPQPVQPVRDSSEKSAGFKILVKKEREFGIRTPPPPIPSRPWCNTVISHNKSSKLRL